MTDEERIVALTGELLAAQGEVERLRQSMQVSTESWEVEMQQHDRTRAALSTAQAELAAVQVARQRTIDLLDDELGRAVAERDAADAAFDGLREDAARIVILIGDGDAGGAREIAKRLAVGATAPSDYNSEALQRHMDRLNALLKLPWVCQQCCHASGHAFETEVELDQHEATHSVPSPTYNPEALRIIKILQHMMFQQNDLAAQPTAPRLTQEKRNEYRHASDVLLQAMHTILPRWYEILVAEDYDPRLAAAAPEVSIPPLTDDQVEYVKKIQEHEKSSRSGFIIRGKSAPIAVQLAWRDQQLAAERERCVAMVDELSADYESHLEGIANLDARITYRHCASDLRALAAAMRAGDADAPPTKTNSPA